MNKWNFDNSYVRLSEEFFTKVEPTKVMDPELVIFNKDLAETLGLDEESLQKESAAEVFAGNELPDGSEPLAQAYAGHQFGNLTMLGDGRAVLLGEQMTPDGERFDIQLKGSGRTPYSRGGDGRASLGPMLREYIISEAMHGLGIPTTRSLAVVTTGEPVIRETELEGAILTRVASSHLRVGTFQFARGLDDVEKLRSLANYAIERHYPDVAGDENKYLSLLERVIDRQAALIAKWQHVGFIHGVMNTDNMTISGETIDYGPCAFMDTYDPKTVFSSIDTDGRYAYGNQPGIGGWNLARFAETLLPLLDEDQEKALAMAQEAMEGYLELSKKYWLDGMRKKLGLFGEAEEDEALVQELLKLMKKHEADFTNTFRALTLGEEVEMVEDQVFEVWYKKWQKRLAEQDASEEEMRERMKANNPAVIPRNHRVEEALKAAVEQDDLRPMRNLLDVLADPYAYGAEQEAYTTPPAPTTIPYRTYCGT
ncbi:protein adenylyltransferase SelO [Thalassobacillus hwangdonensis]|uniref:Protein nucleotidyltransferase YdiU n=1 Tax=Thalassobacillus hwangdonensis TaxID=546108 RepID=A0ABW3L620_9BACI